MVKCRERGNRNLLPVSCSFRMCNGAAVPVAGSSQEINCGSSRNANRMPGPNPIFPETLETGLTIAKTRKQDLFVTNV